MAKLLVPKSANPYSMSVCDLGDYDEPLTIDFSACEFIRPGGLVVIATAMLHARSIGRDVCLELGTDRMRDSVRYAARMDLGDIAFRVGASGDDLPLVKRHPTEDRFVPLQIFDAAGDYYGAIDDIVRALAATADEWEIDKRSLHAAVSEVGINTEQHAKAAGLVAVQHFPARGVVEFAIGDYGLGIPTTLRSAGHQYPDDRRAVRAAVETYATSMKESGRGAGLPALLGICCNDMRGELLVRSGCGRVWYRHAPSEPTGWAVNDRDIQASWPGTLVFGTFRTV